MLSICTLAYAEGKVRKSKQIDIQRSTQGEEILSETTWNHSIRTVTLFG